MPRYEFTAHFPEELVIELTQTVFRSCREKLLKGIMPGHRIHLFMANQDDYSVALVEIPTSAEAPSDLFEKLGSRIVKDTGMIPLAAVHVFTGWYVNRDNDVDKASISPINSADRGSCITVQLQTLDNRAMSGFIPYDEHDSMITIIGDDELAPEKMVKSVSSPLELGFQKEQAYCYDRLLSAFMQGVLDQISKEQNE